MNGNQQIIVGIRIKELRLARKMTLEDLAGRVGMTKSYLWNIENHRHPGVSGIKLSQIAEELGTTTDYLLGTQPLITAQNEAFFREYLKLPRATRKMVREIAQILAKT